MSVNPLFCQFRQNPGQAMCLAAGVEFEPGPDGAPRNVRCAMHREGPSFASLKKDTIEKIDEALRNPPEDNLREVLKDVTDDHPLTKLLNKKGKIDKNAEPTIPWPLNPSPTLEEFLSVGQASADARGERWAAEQAARQKDPAVISWTQKDVDNAVGSYHRTLAGQAHKVVMERQAAYGDPVQSWLEIEALAATICPEVPAPGERAIWTLIAMKIVRNKNSPDNPDHKRDLCGYLSLADMIRTAWAGPDGDE